MYKAVAKLTGGTKRFLTKSRFRTELFHLRRQGRSRREYDSTTDDVKLCRDSRTADGAFNTSHDTQGCSKALSNDNWMMGQPQPPDHNQDLRNVRKVWSGAVDSDHQIIDSKNVRSRNPSRNTKLKFLIVILCLLIVCLLTAFLLLLYYYLSSLQSDVGVCTTPECVKSAANLIQSMDTTADPCDDFYQFACGKWHEEHPIPDSSLSTDWFSNKGSMITRKTREYLELNDTDSEPEPVHQARIMYRACMDIDTLENRSLTPLHNFLQRVGLSSVPPLSNSKTSVMDTMVRMSRFLDKSVLLAVSVTANIFNRTENIITVGNPVDKNPVPSHKEYEKKVEKMLRKTLKKDDQKRIRVWKEYIVLTMNYFLKYNNMPVKDYNNSINIAADKIIDFEISLVELAENYSTNAGYDVTPTIMTIGDLVNQTDTAAAKTRYPTKILWRRYIRNMFTGLDVKPSTDKTKIAVYDLEYLKALSQLLAKTPVTTILLTLWWTVVYTLGPHTTNYMRDLKSDFIEKNIGETTGTSRSLRCTNLVKGLLPSAVGYSVVNEDFLRTTKVKVNEMINEMLQEFNDQIDKTTWIDSVTKNAIKEKAQSIKRNIGFPDWYIDKERIEEYYEFLQVNESTHMENMLQILETNMNYTLAELNNFNYYNSSDFDTLEFNALYDAQENSITLPASILHPPFYNLGLNALDYGAIGSIVGHELIHAFDVNGRKYDKNGNVKEWWSNSSIDSFTEKMACFVAMYNDYYVAAVDEWVDGNLTLAENLADNGGILTSFLGYQSYVKKYGKEQSLPGFSRYTNEQLFFLSFANVWCENWTVQSMRWAVEEVHSPNYVRVMATLSNLPHFAEVWKCKPNVEMNPTSRCELW